MNNEYKNKVFKISDPTTSNINHDLSTLLYIDNILVLKQSKIIEEDTHLNFLIKEEYVELCGMLIKSNDNYINTKLIIKNI